MSLDNRSREILLYMLYNTTMRSIDVISYFDISKRQFNYSFNKINEYLENHYMEKITRTKRGNFVIPKNVYSYIHEHADYYEHTYIYTERERQNLIIFSLLGRLEIFSLLHIAAAAKVSKNTVLIDLKEIQNRITLFHLRIQYNRKTGYQILGEEIDKRFLIMDVIKEMLRTQNDERFFEEIFNDCHQELFTIMNHISIVEKSLKIRLSDEHLSELKYALFITIRRIRQGKMITSLPADYYAISGTNEYNKTDFLLKDVADVSEEEHLFITLQFLISNIHEMSNSNLEDHEHIYSMVEEFVNNFEQISCVQFQNKQGLCRFLFQHFKPAYFRIKYDFHIDCEMADVILNDYNFLKEIVDQSIIPIEQQMHKKIPKSELLYIMIIIGGWLRKENHMIEPNRTVKAVVVCNNGLSVSNYLYMSLKGMFKNIIFLDCISQREFSRYEEPFDIVFSSSFIETDKKLYVVKPMMSKLEKSQFYLHVTCDMLGIMNQNVTIEDIVKIVNHHTRDFDSQKLYKELQAYFYYKEEHEISEPVNETITSPCFHDVLPIENIIIRDRVCSWIEVVDELSVPLIKHDDIEPRYAVEIKRQIKQLHPPIMIDNGFVVLHAGIDDGVKAVCMSLMKLPETITIEGYLKADVFLMLATPDTKLHLHALNQMIDRLIKEEKVKALRQANCAEEAYQIIFQGKSNSDDL